ncbi:hypothetical protein QJS10_CPA08g01047 [Acorus calamus]|uniref:Uncharacterized protein n=1 Tax=Acorus calamus TaxID=4465 RepID=A0AAV9EBS6_ACOCL|nr:hypothetical protein QJS10_CPA08g01047 [Acorus calamus]
MSKKKTLEGFEPIFGSAKPDSDPLHTFLFHAHASDPSRLTIAVVDPLRPSSAWDCVLTVHQLDDLRDEVGIGGEWSDFVEYLKTSLSSDDVKVVLGDDSGAPHAKLIARKSKGMPVVSLSLNGLTNSSARDAMASLSLALFRELKKKQDDVIEEQRLSRRLTECLSSEREKSEGLQKQLDALAFSKKRKALKPKALDKTISLSDSMTNLDTVPTSNGQQSSEMPATHDSQKVSQRVVPVSRRAKSRGVFLQDIEDDDTS